MRISLIVAVAANGVIGRDGGLPWRIPADLRFFKETTIGKPIVMGRKTYQSIGRALPGRHNIVLTRAGNFSHEGVSVVENLDAALLVGGDAEEVMVIGGAEIYALALPRADRIYLTEVHMKPEGNVHFPSLNQDSWLETAREYHPVGDNVPAFSFVRLDRLDSSPSRREASVSASS